ncbi:copper amine oxidase domain protein [Paenibacillus curdlanolyticus YK9]|uniref:Copper amine oxidase domain protein n=1 Tax=Paenibacillus curdlanolyticus YK9 TaxID=717606 RepID=E0I6M6_9BACL|nr:stalk domain-containing protein [Paenibacillus curdlanolyticus]EFM11692.1 copper amine oxidase domain protein [Paenibacillus curdlanolyticus YK9]
MKRRTAQWILTPVLAAALAFAPFVGASPTVHAATPQVAATQTPISVYVDGKRLALTQAPYESAGSTLVPMKAIFNALHVTNIVWEQSSKTLIARKDRLTITMQVGSKSAIVNGKTYKLNAPVTVRNGTTFIPLRFVGETLGANVLWDAKARKVTITSQEAQFAALQKQWEQERASHLKTTAQIVQENDEKIVMITTDFGLGSGVVIGENEILTNYHVMDGATKATALTVDQETFEVAGVVASSEKNDLAIIRTKKPLNIEPVDLNWDYDFEKGDSVIAIGSPLGVQNTASDGIISNITFDGSVEYIQFSAPIDHGSSGGGLFNQYGELIGITSAGYDDTNADLNFAVSIYHIAELLDEYDAHPDAKPAFLPSKLPATLKGASMEEIKAVMDKYFSSIQTSYETAALTNWTVKRDEKGWFVFEAKIDPTFYLVYGEQTSHQLGTWALNTGYELKRMLPGETIQMTINFEQTVEFEPRGYKQEEVTALGDNKWRVAFPVIEYQAKTTPLLKVRSS